MSLLLMKKEWTLCRADTYSRETLVLSFSQMVDANLKGHIIDTLWYIGLRRYRSQSRTPKSKQMALSFFY